MDKVNGAEIDPSFADLNALIAGLSTGNSNRGAYLFDHVNLPEVINVMSIYALTEHFDRNCPQLLCLSRHVRIGRVEPDPLGPRHHLGPAHRTRLRAYLYFRGVH